MWLALAAEAHTHHGAAEAYWDNDAAPVAAFCRVTHMAFLRLLTNTAVMGGHVLSPSAAWAKYTEFLQLPEVRWLAEPLGMEQPWQRFSATGRKSPNLWADAYLAAFATCGGLRVVTFDRGFSRFRGLNCLIL